MLYDITRTISNTTHVWPGDTPYSVTQTLSKSAGDAVNLLTLTLSAHTGTHADATYHYAEDGEHPATMPLAAYIGPARVVHVALRDGPLLPQHLSHIDLTGGERLLIRSHVSDLPDDQWPQTIPYLSVDLIEHLAGLNYKLIGLDSPSVDAFDSKDLPCHHALRRYGLVNLEHLLLRGVPEGDYELVALPLKLDAACGSPVRAILRTLS